MSMLVPLGGFEKCVCVSRPWERNSSEKYHAFGSKETTEESKSMKTYLKYHTLLCRENHGTMYQSVGDLGALTWSWEET